MVNKNRLLVYIKSSLKLPISIFIVIAYVYISTIVQGLFPVFPILILDKPADFLWGLLWYNYIWAALGTFSGYVAIVYFILLQIEKWLSGIKK